MNNRITVILVVLVACAWTTAEAGGWKDRKQPPPRRDMPDIQNNNRLESQNINNNNNTNVNNNANTNINENSSTSSAAASTEQDQAQEQSQANEQTVNFQSRKHAASAIAPGVYSSNPCVYGGSASLGLPKINIGGGRQVVDQNCAKLETARMLGSLGEMELAIAVVCATDAAVEVLGDRCRPSTTLQARIASLEDQKAQLLDLREIDRSECDASKSRIFDACSKK